MVAGTFVPKILVIATEACAYRGADAVGKAHQEYGSNVYAFRVLSPVLFPEHFYLRCYARGIDGILIAACGSDCPYRGAYDRLAKRIDAMTGVLKNSGLGIARVRLTAICTVCIKAYLKEVGELNDKLLALGPVDRVKAQEVYEQSLLRLRGAAQVEDVGVMSAVMK
ncbi:MAG: hydrogenase iron-sulfur subunit [Planctomycetia bacterium]|jgi:coenzyme F420-reducing hydrogenase delta subunit|nr:hydrogenase iron-sulfur subunit [Planctomycetia bacterium]